MSKDKSTIETMLKNEVHRLSFLIDKGKYTDAYHGTIELLQVVPIMRKKYKKIRNTTLYKLAALLIDIGGMEPNENATSLGLEILEDYKTKILKAGIDKASYYYTLSNGKNNSLDGLNYYN